MHITNTVCRTSKPPLLRRYGFVAAAVGVRLLMKRAAILVLLAIWSSSSAELPSCWSDPDALPELYSSEATLRTFLLPINLSDPAGDAQARMKHGDYRVLAVRGFTILFPGLDDLEVTCQVGFRIIEGTSDAYESRSHAELTSEVKRYASAYNEIIASSL